jgi:hypothetical protein
MRINADTAIRYWLFKPFFDCRLFDYISVVSKVIYYKSHILLICILFTVSDKECFKCFFQWEWEENKRNSSEYRRGTEMQRYIIRRNYYYYYYYYYYYWHFVQETENKDTKSWTSLDVLLKLLEHTEISSLQYEDQNVIGGRSNSELSDKAD